MRVNEALVEGADPRGKAKERLPKGSHPVLYLSFSSLLSYDCFLLLCNSPMSNFGLRMSTMGNKARLVAQALTNHGITNQEARIYGLTA